MCVCTFIHYFHVFSCIIIYINQINALQSRNVQKCMQSKIKCVIAWMNPFYWCPTNVGCLRWLLLCSCCCQSCHELPFWNLCDFLKQILVHANKSNTHMHIYAIRRMFCCHLNQIKCMVNISSISICWNQIFKMNEEINSFFTQRFYFISHTFHKSKIQIEIISEMYWSFYRFLDKNWWSKCSFCQL